MSDTIAKLAQAASRFRTGDLPSLVLVTDDERLPDPSAAVWQLPRGSLIVVRAREPHRRAQLAAMLAKIARQRALFVVIADDPLLAARLGCDGVHFPEARAREIAHWRGRRPDWLLTASAHSLRAVLAAGRYGADAVFLSPVFATRSHPKRAALTSLRLRLIGRMSPVPIYALGGIDAGNVGRISGAPIVGIAAIGALAARSNGS